MADPIEITLDEIQNAVNAPVGYAQQVLHRLFNIPVGDPLPNTIKFFDQGKAPQGTRRLVRNQTEIHIGIQLAKPVDKVNILEYITKATPMVIDVSRWKNIDVDPADNPQPPVEPEPEEPPPEEGGGEEPPPEEGGGEPTPP